MNRQPDENGEVAEPEDPAYPWEIGVDETCCCEAMYQNCDAADPWCVRHAEYRESLRFHSRRAQDLIEGRRLPDA